MTVLEEEDCIASISYYGKHEGKRLFGRPRENGG